MKMQRYKQIIHSRLFGNMTFQEIAKNLHWMNADGLDLTMHCEGKDSPETFMRTNIKNILDEYGLKVYGTQALHSHPQDDFSHIDPAARAHVLEYCKKCVDATLEVGAKLLFIAPSYLTTSFQYHTSYAEDWKRSVETVRKLCEYAHSNNVDITIEPVNRYNVALVHTIEESMRMIRDVGMDNLYIVPDVFHMNMEERRGIPAAIREGAGYIKTLHISDTARVVPGYGTVDWRSIITALYETDYAGTLSHEPIYLYFDFNRVSSDSEYTAALMRQYKNGISYLNQLMDICMEAGC